jgi:hypothetical protein
MRALAGGAATGIGVTLSCLALSGVAAAQTLPQVKVPQLPEAPVQVPSLPQVQLPSTKTPSVPSGGSGGGGGGGSVQTPSLPSTNLPSVPVPNFGGGSGGSGGGGSSPSHSGGSSGSSSSGNSSGSGSGSGGSSQSNRASERRLRDSAQELRGCLGTISHFERRVLIIRAGIGGRPQSRAATARQLRTSSRRIARAERSAVRRLRIALKSGRCATSGTVGGSISSAGLLAAVATPSQIPPGSGSGSGSGKQIDRVAVKDVSASSDPKTKDGEPILGAPAGSTSPPPADQSGPIILLWAIGALILGLGTVGLLRRRHAVHAGPLDVPSSKLPPAPWADDD